MKSSRPTELALRGLRAVPPVLLLQALAAAGACDDSLPVVRLRPDADSFTQASGFDEAAQVVVRSANDWTAAWLRLNRHARPVPPTPEIDFDREMVLLATLGLRRSGGYDIRINRAWREGNLTVIAVTSIEPGPGCIATTAITRPADVATMPARPDPVEFRMKQTVRRCD